MRSVRVTIFRAWAVLCLLLACWMVFDYPLAPGLIGLLFFAYGCLLWKFPTVWLFFVPGLLPVLDLAPWTGRFFFDEFDLLLLVTLAVGFWRYEESAVSPVFTGGLRFWLALFVLGALGSTLIGVAPFPPVDANSFANYFSRYNGLRVFKGVGFAIALLPLLKRALSDPGSIRKLFVPGMLVGLAGVGGATLWERQVFPGLFNFDSDFRVVATFSGMHTGGAPIDAYLAAALPFVAGCFLCWRRKLIWFVGVGLLGVGLYSLLVTFSRIDYLAFLVSFLVLGGGLSAGHARGRRLVAGGLVGAAIVFAVALPVVSGSFIQKRFSATLGDVDIRLAHWREAVWLMDDDPVTSLLGMGLGSYPRIYAMGSSNRERPSNYTYKREGDNSYLSLPSGGFLYLDQRVSLRPDTPYVLKMDLRSADGDARLVSSVCEKSLMHSFESQWLVQTAGDTLGEWVAFEKSFNSGKVGEGSILYQRRPVALSLLNDRAGAVVEVDNLELLDESGNNLLENGDFSAGNDFWFFTSDNHLPWHIKNLWVHLIFEQGWLGLAAFNLFLFYCFKRMVRNIFWGDPMASVLLASLAGVLTVGLVDSLLDFPRITLLLLLLLFTGCLYRCQTDEREASSSFDRDNLF